MKVYIDDMMVKTKIFIDHVSNLEDVFAIVRGYKMHLNLKKCIF